MEFTRRDVVIASAGAVVGAVICAIGFALSGSGGNQIAAKANAPKGESHKVVFGELADVSSKLNSVLKATSPQNQTDKAKEIMSLARQIKSFTRRIYSLDLVAENELRDIFKKIESKETSSNEFQSEFKRLESFANDALKQSLKALDNATLANSMAVETIVILNPH